MSAFRRRLAEERGFTMITVILTMTIVGLFAVGAWQSAVGDIGISRNDQDRKRAYDAAVSGAEWYAYQLAKSPVYWTGCTSVPTVNGSPAPVNNVGSKARTMTIPGTDMKFAIELIPASPATTCSTADPSGSMLTNNTLTIRSTGFARGEKRQVVTTFRHKNFLDYIYLTKYETFAPAIYASYGSYFQTVSWANLYCADKFRGQRSDSCAKIQFASDDTIQGSFHTDDTSILTCDTPTFGRNGNDTFEVNGSSSNYYSKVCGYGNPTINATKVLPGGSLPMPPSNSELAASATDTFSGNTCLNLGSSTIDVYPNINCTGTKVATISQATDTVVYVSNSGTCSGGYDASQAYDNPTTCGDVMVKANGTAKYTGNITVGAANDIIISGNVQHSGNGLLGLIANNFVRVAHPVNRSASCGSSYANTNVNGTTPPATFTNITIDAAILSLTQSFIVDNWNWGPLGTLTVNGAIAQKYRGPVGQSGSCNSGYTKNYVYDDRLKYRSPPQFIDPVQSAWRIMRQTEKSPVA